MYALALLSVTLLSWVVPASAMSAMEALESLVQRNPSLATHKLFERQNQIASCATSKLCNASDVVNNYNFLNALGNSTVYITAGFPQPIAATNGCTFYGYVVDNNITSSSSPAHDFGFTGQVIQYQCSKNGLTGGQTTVSNNANLGLLIANFNN